MKELSVEDKAKRYDEALHKAKRIINVCVDDNTECRSMIACIQQIFPELKENEDERIREWLIEMVEEVRKANPTNVEHNGMCSKSIAWLEKQGEQKQELLTKEKALKNSPFVEQKPQIKLVFPKFRVGDIIQHIPLEKWDTTKKITHIDETGYYFDHSHQGDTVSGGLIGFLSENDYELVKQKPVEWSEEDEKMINKLIDFMLSGIDISKAPYGCVAWLKSLKDRYTWKPSDEQMNALQTAIGIVGELTPTALLLKEIREQLKKLKA